MMRIVPLRLSGFGSVAMYWRADAMNRPAVDGARECLRQVVAEFIQA
ncbi:MAG: hypothetical protein MO853_02720 [Candidatus Protistobacter heckmanni]|nr:hypothetical protein [Candidatus Protistobacter heckmanni]